VSKFKTMFEKGYTPNWTTEVFKITKVQKTNPVTYCCAVDPIYSSTARVSVRC